MATDPNIDPALNNTSNEGDGTVTLTQEKIDSIIDKAVGRATAPHKAALAAAEARTAQLEADLQAAKEAAKTRTTTSGDGTKTPEQWQAELDEIRNAGRTNTEQVERQKLIIQDKEREAQAAKQEAQNVRRDVAIQNAASKLEFVDLGVVTKLTKDFITIDADTGRFTVVGDNGQPRMNSAYEPMSLDEFYNDFAAKNKYLVRSNYTAGTGQHESSRSNLSANGKYELAEIFGPKSDSSKAMALHKADPAEYARLKSVAKAARLIA